MAADALSTVTIVGSACTTPVSGIVLRARPSGLDLVQGFRLLCFLSFESWGLGDKTDTTDVFLVETFAGVDLPSLVPDESVSFRLCPNIGGGG